jgi:hypothetical protein
VLREKRNFCAKTSIIPLLPPDACEIVLAVTKRQRARRDSTEIALTSLLDALAPVLMPLDITPARLAQIARASFAKIGAKQLPLKTSGRPHIAKIASATGLSRAEVKRLVACNFDVEIAGPESMPRALRVLYAWQNSPLYKRRGKPKSLPIIGTVPSFESLCKSNSGDIPFTVILDELLKRGCAKLARGKQKVFLTPVHAATSRNLRYQAMLAFANSLLRDALDEDAVLLKRVENISTSSDLPDAYVEGAIAGRLSELLDELPKQFVRRGRPARGILTVSTLLVRNQRKG